MKERDAAAKSCFAALDKGTERIARDWKKPCDAKLAAQKKLLAELDDLATACRDLVKDVDLVFKLAVRVVGALGFQRNASSPSPPSDGGEGVIRAARDLLLPRLMSGEIAV